MFVDSKGSKDLQKIRPNKTYRPFKGAVIKGSDIIGCTYGTIIEVHEKEGEHIVTATDDHLIVPRMDVTELQEDEETGRDNRHIKQHGENAISYEEIEY